MSSYDYARNWSNGTGHSLGSARFAGQTRNRRLTDKSIEQTTYGFCQIGIDQEHGGMVATISEIIKSDIIDAQIKRLEDKIYVQS